MEKKLGEQIIENYEKNSDEKGVETRELSVEVYNKKIRTLVEKTIEEGCKEYGGEKFYIVLYGYNDPYVDKNLAHFKIIGRKSRPSPEWKQTVFSYDPNEPHQRAFKYEWMLPKKESAMEMIVNPSGWHPHLIENIQKFLDGRLQ